MEYLKKARERHAFANVKSQKVKNIEEKVSINYEKNNMYKRKW